MKSASAPPLMCCLKPLMTQESPSRTARVRMPPTSEPAVGSLMASAVVISAAHRGRRKRSICSAVPNSSNGLDTKLPLTAR